MWNIWIEGHVRGTITDVAGECPYTDDTAKVLCKGVKLLFWKIGRKAVNVNVRYARLARVCSSECRYTGCIRVKLDYRRRIG
jgi:hypothetical protein